jgi:hypothetical protein
MDCILDEGDLNAVTSYISDKIYRSGYSIGYVEFSRQHDTNGDFKVTATDALQISKRLQSTGCLPPPNSQCEYYALNDNSVLRQDTFELFSGEGSSLKCLDKYVEESIAICQKSFSNSSDCFMMKDENGKWMNRAASYVDDSGLGGGLMKALSGQVLDSNCNIIQDAVPADKLCGELVVNWQISPISLDWNMQGALRRRHATVVNFPLMPSHREFYYLWQATEEFPLLAIDTNGDGKITDGSELFGNWTFGGKQVAALNGIESLGASRGAWRDGFEALATLDIDGDGALTGEELSKIVLFFDRDRDSISDPGELLSASSAGLTKLFVKETFKDPVTGDVIARRGFERVVNGEVIGGTAIDWYAKGFPNSLSAFQEISKDLVVAKTGNPPKSEPLTDPNPPSNKPQPAEVKHSTMLDTKLSGAWRWKIDGHKETAGVLILSSEGGVVRGSSLIEVPVTARDEARWASRGMIMSHRFTGSLSSEKGEPTLAFSINTDGRNVRSSATLESTGMLIGSSTQKLSTGEEVTYTWKAERVL